MVVNSGSEKEEMTAERFDNLIITGVFLLFAIEFFYTGHPAAGGWCVAVAVLKNLY
jgi:hypothetical protein